MMKTSTAIALTVGTVVTGILAYAVYFDHKRRTDPEFRKALKRDARRQARMAKEAKEVEGKQQKEAIKRAVEEAQEEGFPSDIEEREAFFMKEVAEGEARNGEGSDPVGAALCFYKALKVYPEPKTLINIYENTVSKDVLEILAVMCTQDKDLNNKIGGSASGSESGHGVE
ncbi:hypothetical protein GJ744_002126 [Endocarpon pusillum]|uniref:Mitochondrial import receptor subunit tom-20 n=1 Tax=Endocarpon pusillum TaxID=364733 RepID=A0A8H7E2V1_9EURO|nr:hypothetical protein GJ744_002126 [Endocarpon pusillum]